MVAQQRNVSYRHREAGGHRDATTERDEACPDLTDRFVSDGDGTVWIHQVGIWFVQADQRIGITSVERGLDALVDLSWFHPAFAFREEGPTCRRTGTPDTRCPHSLVTRVALSRRTRFADSRWQ